MSERLTELSVDERAHVEAVLSQHGRYIEAVAARYACHPDAVPDVVQEVSVRLCQSLGSVREPRYLKTWLFKVTQNAAISMFRRESRQMPAYPIELTADDPSDLDATPGVHYPTHVIADPTVHIEADIIADDDLTRRRRILHRGIDEVLTPRQREAVRHMIAPKRVNISRRADHPAISRARKRLRRWMRDEGYEAITPDPEPKR